MLPRLLDYVVGSIEAAHVPGGDVEEKVGFKYVFTTHDRYPFIASEILSSEMPSVTQALFTPEGQDLLENFWQNFIHMAAGAPHRPVPHHEHPLTKAAYGPKAAEDSASADSNEEVVYSARTHGPSFMVLAGYWTKVNAALLERHPQEMLDFVKTMPATVQGMTAHFETPAVVEFLFRLIQSEDNVPDAGMIAWLSEQGLIPQVVSLLSPSESPDMHKSAAEFLKTIISMSAPSPSSLNQVTMQESFGGPGEMLLGAGGVNNILVRELASPEMVQRMINYMFPSAAPPAAQGNMQDGPPESAVDSDEDAVDDSDEDDDLLTLHAAMKDRQNRHLSRRLSLAGTNQRDSTVTVRPSMSKDRVQEVSVPSADAAPSSFVNCVGVFIELIRKNNSDYFEQHLFHTLRNYLLLRQQEAGAASAAKRGAGQDDVQPHDELSLDNLALEDDSEIAGLDEAMEEVAKKMGIVHLGPLLRMLADKIPEFQAKMRAPPPDAAVVETSLGPIEPLTQTRYCITELYAEMLHCSNMALLNRAKNAGPRYSASGSLLGGLAGLQTLARTLQGEDEYNDNEEDEPESANASWSPAPSSSQKSEAGASDSEASGSSASTTDDEASEEDAASIASALSSMSLAELVAHMAPARVSREDILGNYLKRQFLNHGVLEALVELFLECPWNNFLHNVVYDILQQLFNGDMESMINRELTVSAFNDAHLVEMILEGVRRNQESSSQRRRIRIGYMGHLSLIAEEILKLVERFPSEIGRSVEMHFTPAWSKFVQEDLKESRAKESVPLAGGRPTAGGLGMQNWSNLESDDWYSENENNQTFAQYLSQQIRYDGANDEAENNVLSYMGNSDSLLHQADGNEWGPFNESAPSAFEFTSTANVTTNTEVYQENLTPADWAAEFRRDACLTDMPADPAIDNDSDSDDMGSSAQRDDRSASSTDSEDNVGEESPFVDLHKPASLRTRAQSLERVQPERAADSHESDEAWPAASAARHVRTLSSGGEDHAAQLAMGELGEGVEPTEEGLLRRTLADGTTVTVPLDDAELHHTMNS